jgi:hypothetical protein
LVDDRKRGGEAVGDQHALVARNEDGADLSTGRLERSQPGGGLVVLQLRRHHGDEGSRRRWLLRDEKGRADEGAGTAGGGDARGQDAEAAV